MRPSVANHTESSVMKQNVAIRQGSGPETIDVSTDARQAWREI
jgi:hypothetical protein